MSLVVHAVHELGWHKDLVSVVEASHTGEVSGVVVCIQVVEVGPGMDYVPLLWIILAVERVEIVIEATFVAVAPENDGGVVHVAGNQRFHQFRSYFSTIGVLPSR